MKKLFLIFALLPPFSARAETAAEFISRVEKNVPPPIRFAMSVKTEGGSMNYEGALKDKKWRMDGTVNGQNSTVLFDGKDVVIVMMGMAMKHDGADKMIDLPDGNGFELGEQTSVGGQPCRMIVRKSEKVCISERYALPIYAETNGSVMTVTDIRETAVPDSEFDPPANIPVMDMSNALRFGG